MSRSKRFLSRLRFSSCVLLLCVASVAFGAPAGQDVPKASSIAVIPSAPGAGGYTSDYGSDYGVGLSQSGRHLPPGRQPIAVIGLRAITVAGTPQPWIGLRFGDELARRLDAFMGTAPAASSLSRILALRGLRVQDIGILDPQNAGPPQRALALLKGGTARSRFSLALFGDVILGGPASNPGTPVTIRVHVARLVSGGAEPVTPLVLLQASWREWAQLPARTALAVLDAMKISLDEDERTALLREASPLMPFATPARMATEQRLGQAVAAAIESHVLQEQYRRTAPSNFAQRHFLLARAFQQGDLAVRELRAIARMPVSARATNGNSTVNIVRTAKEWLPSTAATTRRSHLQLKILNRSVPRVLGAKKAALVKSSPPKRP
jgi:hypothetical protein